MADIWNDESEVRKTTEIGNTWCLPPGNSVRGQGPQVEEAGRRSSCRPGTLALDDSIRRQTGT